MDVGICDDDQACRAAILQLIKTQNVQIPVNIFIFSTLEELLCTTQSLDLIFLDIEVGQENSLEYFNRYHNLQRIPLIVLISSHSCYITQSYQVAVFQFLLKPIYPEVFAQVFSACCEQYRKLQQVCDLWDKQGRLWQVPLQRIVCIKSLQRKIIYYDTKESEYFGAASSLAAVLEDLKSFGFCQIAKGCLVNLGYVIDVEKQGVLIRLNNRVGKLTIGKKYLEEAKQQHLRYLVAQEGN